MSMPDLITSYEYRGHVDVEWFDVLKKEDIPNLPWQQVYIIGNYEGKVPVVVYPDEKDNLPGGKTEHGETLEHTMRREVEEELNMQVAAWEPLGYQVCTRKGIDEITYQFRVYATLEKIGDFTHDPGGRIIGHRLVKLRDLNNVIGYGDIGERLIASADKYFSR